MGGALMTPPHENGRPWQGGRQSSTAISDVAPLVHRETANWQDIDALAEHLRGVYVVQLVVSDAGHRRSYFYKNLDAAQRAVGRARERGRSAHLTLVQMIPVGVIGGGLR